MTDIFDTKVICRNCNIEMQKKMIHKDGVDIRAMVCENCGDRILHPEDLNSLNDFKNIRNKTYVVKLRMVGNSHAISIPKEILDFMNDQHSRVNNMRKEMNEMVRLCFEDFDTLKVQFGDEDEK